MESDGPKIVFLCTQIHSSYCEMNRICLILLWAYVVNVRAKERDVKKGSFDCHNALGG